MGNVAFIPNDPLASGGPGPMTVKPRTFPRTGAGWVVQPSAAAGQYEPHTPDFDFWQTQEALIRGLAAWRQWDGKPLPAWQGSRKKLPVQTNAGDDLNAFYDRQSLQFFAHTFNGHTVHSAESVDIVCHEQGHALLDAVRPDFWDVPFIEVASLHEAFGDCMALLAALNDPVVRKAVVDASPDLSGPHFVESLAEELGDAIAREFGRDSSEDGALRHADNKLQWVDPTTLPPNAPVSQLAGEVHSFSRVFTGVFYDLIRNIYRAGSRDPNGLRNAARVAGRLLISAIRGVPARPRVDEAMGRRMLQIDIEKNGGANVAAIQAAFEAHAIVLPAPAKPLAVPMTRGGRTTRGATRELRERLETPEGRVQFTPVDTDDEGEIAHVTGFRPVELSGELQGVHVLVPGVARVRTRGRSVVGVLGDVLPAAEEAERQARAFAQVLVANGDLRGHGTGTAPAAPAGRRTRGRAMAPAPQRPATAPLPPTHEIRDVDGRPTIVRLGFSCYPRFR
ncbi:MAG: hypothetical protein ACJ77N_12350 [Chloroflexota bacterium]